MTEVPELAISAGRRHIIKRPRLTRLLDETSARVILLVAPAGYGKTTLAREWLENRGHPNAWYQATPASTDIAAFAGGLARAAATIASRADQRLRNHLKVIDDPERAGQMLGEVLARDLQSWPRDAWLVVDDYHLLLRSQAADRFTEALCQASAVRLLVTTRERPPWASARRVLYGEILELDRTALAMTNDEASQLLGGRRADRIVELAAGWPAVLALAALSRQQPDPDANLPEALHTYFAEELYRDAHSTVGHDIALLAVVPSPVTFDRCRLVFDERATVVLGAAVKSGFLTPRPGGVFDLHRLLRGFLGAKLDELDSAVIKAKLTPLSRHLIRELAWDDAFEVVTRLPDVQLYNEFLTAALDPALESGRLTTIDRWLCFARENAIDAPTVDLAEAELALRRAQFKRASVYANRAARALPVGDRRLLHPLLIRGRIALLSDRYEEAIDIYGEAATLSPDETDRRAALWGSFIAHRYLERDETTVVLDALQELGEDSPEASLRLSIARSLVAGLNHDPLPIEDLAAAAHLIDRARDPHAVTTFLQNYGWSLMMAARYEDALAVAEDEIRVADQYGLRFVDLNARVGQAFAQLGLKRVDEATTLLDAAEAEARELGDAHNLTNVAVARIRLMLSQGRARDVAPRDPAAPLRPPAPSMHGEYYGTCAIAFACAGRYDDAARNADRADGITRSLESRTATRFARAIIAARREQAGWKTTVTDAYLFARRTRHLDGFVAAYRSFPRLLDVLLAQYSDEILAVLRQANDLSLATVRASGAALKGAPALSARELQVLRLVARGYTNKQIARDLFISEATVKVHVHHILEKLNVRSRTEAALALVADELHAAPRA